MKYTYKHLQNIIAYQLFLHYNNQSNQLAEWCTCWPMSYGARVQVFQCACVLNILQVGCREAEEKGEARDGQSGRGAKNATRQRNE